jgi:hypothetical protein
VRTLRCGCHSAQTHDNAPGGYAKSFRAYPAASQQQAIPYLARINNVSRVSEYTWGSIFSFFPTSNSKVVVVVAVAVLELAFRCNPERHLGEPLFAVRIHMPLW